MKMQFPRVFPRTPRFTTLSALLSACAAGSLSAQTIPNPGFETDSFTVFPGYVSGNGPITGWTGGPYGVGSRTKLPYTRAMISAAIKGILDEAPSEIEPVFGLRIPNIIPGVPSKMLNPSKSWDNSAEYRQMADSLITKFRLNIAQYKGLIEDELLTLL